MNKKLIQAVAVALMLGASSLAKAEGLAWDYVALSWTASGEIKAGSDKEDFDGYRLSVVKSLGNAAFLRADSNNLAVSAGGANFDFGVQQLGVGAHLPLSAGAAPLDVWAALDYDRLGFEGLVGTGFGLDVGVRLQLTRELELGLAYKLSREVDFDVGDGDFDGYELGASYAITPKTAVQLSFSNYTLDIEGDKIDYRNIIGLGVRLSM